MPGMMTVIAVDGTKTVHQYAKGPPDLEEIQAAVAGYLETVPCFIRYDGEECVVFCNDEGKLDGLAFNEAATVAWNAQLESKTPDAIFGPVAILQGDAKFLAEL